ncbi:MAG: hemC [Sediminibacterium sp.]|nr:hemC [Sediminibacterium sp.]
MKNAIRIGTRDSQLAVWQATLVKDQLHQQGIASELVFIKSEGDIDLVTPLYELGVQGIFTQTLDTALLNNRIDIAVHSMKDVPTQMAKGIVQAAVLPRASYKDLLVYKGDEKEMFEALDLSDNSIPNESGQNSKLVIATSSIRRKAQWLNRYPNHTLENLRGNVNTRLRKVAESNWNGAIFAAAGLERIGLRPENSIELDWMLPAPAQGAIMIVCREEDLISKEASAPLNDDATALCTKIERDFLRALLGGCATPISALAQWKEGNIVFSGNILSVDGKEKISIELDIPSSQSDELGSKAAEQLLNKGADKIVNAIRNA